MMKKIIFSGVLAFLLAGSWLFWSGNNEATLAKEKIPVTAKTAYFAGGCFWCMESDFEKLNGVYEAVSGYSGGSRENATYRRVSSGATQHYEAVKVYYDPAKVTYKQLVEYFWRHVNPADSGGQFVDRGPQYRTAIFVTNEKERKIAEASKAALEKAGVMPGKIVTPILPMKGFYDAEGYHQDYYKTHPYRYHYYRRGSGRDSWLTEHWGKTDYLKKSELVPTGRYIPTSDEGAPYRKPPVSVLKKKLSPLQYRVTQQAGTEPPFNNKYWNNKQEGIYVDVISGEPLFSSLDKFKSGTGWPSFVKPLKSDNIKEKSDYLLFYKRTEVRSKHADSHLGHVFEDGPKDRGGLRYCINSAALRFVPLKDMEKEGYGQYIKQFLPRGSN